MSDFFIYLNLSYEDFYFVEFFCYFYFGEFLKVEMFYFDGFNSLFFFFSRMKRISNLYF